MNTTRRELLKGLFVAPLLGAAAIKAATPINQPIPVPVPENQWKFFPSGTLIVIAGGWGTGKTYFMREILLPQVIHRRNVFWSRKPYGEAEIPNYPECVVFLTGGVHNHYQLLELKEFAVQHQCCIVVEYQTIREAMQIHDSIQIEVSNSILSIPDVFVWMQPIFSTGAVWYTAAGALRGINSNLEITLRPVLVKNRFGDLQHPPFEMQDVILSPSK